MDHLIQWLLTKSDPSIIYQVKRDLLECSDKECQKQQLEMLQQGWVQQLLSYRKNDGHWGKSVYNPKWTCTHYVLYELVQLCVLDSLNELKKSSELLLSYPQGKDGGINYARTVAYSDACINGMILTIVSYFNVINQTVYKIMDYLLKIEMKDGGWNCEYYHGATHSSLHTTISVLEGFFSLLARNNEYRKHDITKAIDRAISFILRHNLYRSETTGEVIKDEFFKFAFPVRWKYDILRCLDLFQKYDVAYDERMVGALDIMEKSRSRDATWKAATQAGKTYFTMEKTGSAGKWNTLRALRVLVKYNRQPAFI